MSKIYAISLFNQHTSSHLVVNVTAETALEAIAEAKAWNPGYTELEACELIGVSDAKTVSF